MIAALASTTAFCTALAADPSTQPASRDWPMWGGCPARNAVSAATGIPTQWDVKSTKNIKWAAPLGSYTYGGPVIAGGKVYVGTNNGGQFRPEIQGDRGCVLCFDARSGELLWQATHDKLAAGAANDWPEQGVASTPYVDGDRVYYVSNGCELVCADVAGFHDGKNDGPFQSEEYTGPQDADFIWVLDMIAELGVYPHNLAACSPVGAGDLVFVCTSNGVDDEHEKPPAPGAPSFIAVNKTTGKVVWKRSDPGANILHGQWSSPAYGVVGGQSQVIFGGGDGWCYAFEPATGRPLWKFELNPKDAVWKAGGTGTKASIVSTPVFVGDTVYLAVGDDPEQCNEPGHLYAIDATKTGDITETGRVWHVGGDEFGATISSVAVADGLLYAADFGGFLSCFDAQTGRQHWRYDMQAAIWGSPLIVDEKVLLGTSDGEMVVLKHGPELKELARNEMRHPIYTSAAVADGVLYVATQKFLYAIAATDQLPSSRPAESQPAGRTLPNASAPAASAPSTMPSVAVSSPPPPNAWPMFRGNSQLTGVATGLLPPTLHVRWKYDAKNAISSTAAIHDGLVYVGSEDGTLVALDLATGTPKWRCQTDGGIESSPAVADGLVAFGDDKGVMTACDAQTGTVRWRYHTDGQIISSVNPLDGRLLFGSYDGTLYCLRAADGEQVWKYKTEERVHATPAVIGTYALIAGCDAHLHVIDTRDGKLVRKVALDSVTGCSPAVRGNRVFLGTYGQQVLAIDWQAGRVLWRFEDTEHSQPFLSSAALADVPIAGAMAASQPASGPAASFLVIVGGRDKRLRALDPDTGRPRWEFVTRGKIDSSPVVVGNRVFVGSDDGILYAVNVENGAELWRFEAGAPISASPAVADGCLVIGTEDGVLYCFGAAP